MELRIPNSLVWTITERCNLRCEHCSIIGLNGEAKDQEIGTERCFELIKDFAKLKIFSISFTGGEPLVRKDFEEILKYAHQNGIVCTLASNGLLIDKRLAETLALCEVPVVAISLDGYNEYSHDQIRGKGSFKKSLEAINNLKNLGIKVSVSVAIGNNNLYNYEKMLEYFYGLNIDSVKVQVISYFDRVQKFKKDKILSLNYEQLKYLGKITNEFCRKKNKYFVKFACNVGFLNYSYLSEWVKEPNPLGTCGVGTDMLMIRANGTVTTCIHGYLNETLGNLKETGLSEIINQSKDILQKWYNKTNINGNCNSCSVFSSCKGGCRALAELETQKFFESDPNCNFYELNIK